MTTNRHTLKYSNCFFLCSYDISVSTFYKSLCCLYHFIILSILPLKFPIDKKKMYYYIVALLEKLGKWDPEGKKACQWQSMFLKKKLESRKSLAVRTLRRIPQKLALLCQKAKPCVPSCVFLSFGKYKWAFSPSKGASNGSYRESYVPRSSISAALLLLPFNRHRITRIIYLYRT